MGGSLSAQARCRLPANVSNLLLFTLNYTQKRKFLGNGTNEQSTEKLPNKLAEADVHRWLSGGEIILLDVREESEWNRAHAKDAQYLGKGVLERDLETRFADKATEIIMYCGGGFRSALTCDAAQKMGYTNVKSLETGYQGMITADWPMES